MADEGAYITSIPGRLLDFYLWEGKPAVVYEEDGVKRAAYFEPPDRFYEMDPWLLEWGDLAGVAFPQPIDRFSFGLHIDLARSENAAKHKEDARAE